MASAAPVPRRADGAEQVGTFVALIGGLAWARAAPRPLPHEAVLLADAGFVLEPDLDRLALRQAGAVSVQRRGEVFLKAATVSSSLAGWHGRALTCEKPSCLRILPIVRSWYATPKRSATICCRSTRRQRTTPWTARSGPVSTTSASCASCSAERRGGWPFDQLSLSPSGPRSLKRCTQSRSVWRSMPPIRAASARLIPSSTAASDSRRRLWLACLEAAARRRSSSAEKSALTVTAVAMARILPRHGISSTSRGKSPASQNGRPLVLPPDYPDDMQPKHRRKERNRSVQQEQPDRRRNGRDDPHEKGKKASRHVFARHGSVLSILRRDRAWRRKGFGRLAECLPRPVEFAGRVNPAFTPRRPARPRSARRAPARASACTSLPAAGRRGGRRGCPR